MICAGRPGMRHKDRRHCPWVGFAVPSSTAVLGMGARRAPCWSWACPVGLIPGAAGFRGSVGGGQARQGAGERAASPGLPASVSGMPAGPGGSCGRRRVTLGVGQSWIVASMASRRAGRIVPELVCSPLSGPECHEVRCAAGGEQVNAGRAVTATRSARVAEHGGAAAVLEGASRGPWPGTAGAYTEPMSRAGTGCSCR